MACQEFSLILNDALTNPPNKGWAEELVRRLRLYRFSSACGTSGTAGLPLSHAVVSSGALAGASVTLAALLPAATWAVAVLVKVTTAITGATSFSVGTPTNAIAWSSTTGVALNSTNSAADFNVFNFTLLPTGSDVVLTANGSNFTGGVVQVTAWYIDPALFW